MVKPAPRLVGQRSAIAGLVVVLAAIALVPPHAEADAPTCRYTIDMAADTVHDNDADLTWQRTVDGSTYYVHSAAVSYCQTLPLAGGGWRLPSIQELQTIVDDGKFAPAIDSAAFPNTPGAGFWSSSVYTGNPSYAWIVYFYSGFVNFDYVGSTHRVRCVR